MPSANSNATGSSGRGEALNISMMPFQFNPPLHPSLNHVWTNIGAWTTGQEKASLEAIYDETANKYSGDSNKIFNKLRLGRIAMADESLAFALKDGVRYGFRFLYNPDTVQGGSTINTSFIPDPTNAVTAVLQDGLETIKFVLLLNRVPEVMGGASVNDYSLPISLEDMRQIKERGTHYDIEFLYRVCNGIHNTKARRGTGDIGILLPNPSELYLGPFRSRGALVNLSVEDRMFSPDMVPVISYVTVEFARYLTTASGGLIQDGAGPRSNVALVPSIRLAEAGGENAGLLSMIRAGIPGIGGILGSIFGSDDSGTPGGTGDPAPPTGPPPVPGNGAALSGGQVYRVALDAGWNTSDANLMTKIAFAESSWIPTAKNSLPCLGLWQINMSPSMAASRRKQFGITSNEQLFDPRTNAKAAMMLFKGQGLRAWEAYTNGNYKKAPAW
jgi:hypothetical protein